MARGRRSSAAGGLPGRGGEAGGEKNLQEGGRGVRGRSPWQGRGKILREGGEGGLRGREGRGGEGESLGGGNPLWCQEGGEL